MATDLHKGLPTVLTEHGNQGVQDYLGLYMHTVISQKEC